MMRCARALCHEYIVEDAPLSLIRRATISFPNCLEPERAILGLADYKFWCDVLVSAFLAMVSGNSINPKLYGACPSHFICPVVTALKRLFWYVSALLLSGLLLYGSCNHRLHVPSALNVLSQWPVVFGAQFDFASVHKLLFRANRRADGSWCG